MNSKLFSIEFKNNILDIRLFIIEVKINLLD